jgi:hypothetical protein
MVSRSETISDECSGNSCSEGADDAFRGFPQSFYVNAERVLPSRYILKLQFIHPLDTLLSP